MSILQYRLSSSAILLCLAAPAAAQDDSVRTLPEIVVTATRDSAPARTVPARVTVLDGAGLRARGVVRLADALRDVPGLTVAQVGSWGGLTSVFVRGGESDYVQVLVDGVPQNDPGGAYDFSNLTLENVDRVEIVRGPASVLYGSDAVAGVVQVFTQRGAGPARATAGVRAGSVGGATEPDGMDALEVDVGASGGDARIGWSVAAARRETEGLYAFNNDYRNTTVSGRLQGAPDDLTTVDLSVRYADTRYHFPTDGAGNAVDRNAFRTGATTTLGLALARQLSRTAEARLLVTSNTSDNGLDDRADDAADTLGVFASRAQTDLRRQGADGRVLFQAGPRVRITVGAAAEQERERSVREDRSSFGTFTGGTDTAVTRFNHAWYAQARVGAGPATVTAGGRVDANEEFGVFPTVRGGVTLEATPATRVHVAAGTAFKEPTFFENFGGASVAGNPDLDPERSVSAELGVEQALLDGRLVLAATGFIQRFRDLIDFTFAAPAGDPNFFNVAAASADGVELEVTARPAAGLSVAASWARLRTVVTDSGFDGGAGAMFGDDQRLLRRPRATTTLDVRYRAGRVHVGAAARHVGSREDLDFSVFPFSRTTLDAYTIVDLHGQVRVTRRFSASLRVENAFDEEYQEAFGFLARPRTVWVGVRVGA